MSVAALLAERPDPRFRWSLHILFALLAPVLAHCVHSFSVLQRDFRLYNAELWVLFVGDRFHDWRLGIVLGTLVESLLTFLGLWAVVKRPAWRWTVWLCFVALWTYLAFLREVAIK